MNLNWIGATNGAYEIVEQIRVGTCYAVLGRVDDGSSFATWWVDSTGGYYGQYTFYNANHAYQNLYARAYYGAKAIYGEE